MSCAICQSEDSYDHRLNNHNDNYGVYLDADRMRLVVYDGGEEKSDMVVLFCPICGDDLRAVKR